MIRTKLARTFGSLLLLAAGAFCAAQVPATSAAGKTSTAASPTAQQPVDDEPIQTLHIESNEVNLVFSVTDKNGHFITGLQRQDFALLDNQLPPEAVLHFSQQTNLPLRVGIMLDTSSSIRNRFKFEQDSAIDFLLQTLHRDDRAFIEGFDVQTDIEQNYTNNPDLLNQGIQRLRPGGGTALYDALYKTCRDQMLTLRHEDAVRKVLILVSDGDDNYSRALETDAIKECQRAETAVYTISTNISPSKDKGDDVLNLIARQTGGRAFFPTKLEDIAVDFKNIQEELRSQYMLEYRPANFKADGSYRPILLRAINSRYYVSSRSGYFAPSPAAR